MAHEVGAMADQLVITSEPRVATPLRVPRQVGVRRPRPGRRIESVERTLSDGADLPAPPALASVGPILATASRASTAFPRTPEAAVSDPRPRLEELRARRVAALSFELRSTLALISGYSQALLHLPLGDDSRRQYLEQIPVAAANLAELVNEILGATDEAEAEARPIRPIALPKVRSR